MEQSPLYDAAKDEAWRENDRHPQENATLMKGPAPEGFRSPSDGGAKDKYAASSGSFYKTNHLTSRGDTVVYVDECSGSNDRGWGR